VSGPQARFAGSDREGRGRIVSALRRGPLAADEVAAAAGWADDPDRAARVVAGLVADGMVVRGADGALALPGGEGSAAVRLQASGRAG
jgi:hypothetical protein